MTLLRAAGGIAVSKISCSLWYWKGGGAADGNKPGAEHEACLTHRIS